MKYGHNKLAMQSLFLLPRKSLPSQHADYLDCNLHMHAAVL